MRNYYLHGVKGKIEMTKRLFYFLILITVLGCDSGDNSNGQTPQDNDTIIDNEPIGKLQDRINNAVNDEIIDLTDFDIDDTSIVIDKKLTIKNGSLDDVCVKITSDDVSLQNIKSIKNKLFIHQANQVVFSSILITTYILKVKTFFVVF